jgi:hypothetical protein
MWAALTSLYVSAIVIVVAFLFAAVHWLEPQQAEWQSQSNYCIEGFAVGDGV